LVGQKLDCRGCGNHLSNIFIDLGKSPLANSYLKKKEINKKEKIFPLKVFVCKKCYFVQLPEFENPKKIFSEYAYFSSFSSEWVAHARDYVDMITKKLKLNHKRLVMEIASNDGYLLQFFLKKKIPVLGIEPAKNIAKVAQKKGITTKVEFFGTKLALKLEQEGTKPDLIVANNVLAHVPKIHDFVEGLKIILNTNGVITIEVPHLLKLIKNIEFDTIYHEHYSYFSLNVLKDVFEKHNLTIFDVKEISTHGGSLRVFIKHEINQKLKISKNVERLLNKEREEGLQKMETYENFEIQVNKVKKELIDFLENAKKNKKKVIAYGAPAKGNTLLNFSNITNDLIEFTVDKNPYKQKRFLPGSHIPIKKPEMIMKTNPDFILILPWNIKYEIIKQIKNMKKWEGKFVIPIPKLKII
jgi:SAM-dependent methyltransferase|tara:strand:- start:2112 stop:3350 length:1239 start_codon:yes stop_codon:yes gene_type:complete